ncbi:MAG: MFS transporter [Janthinobacterium lividum]
MFDQSHAESGQYEPVTKMGSPVNGMSFLSRSSLLRTFGIASVGGALEFYDFIIFVFLTQTIGLVFFPPETPIWIKQTEVFSLFAAGYLARPIGGLVMAHVGDTTGRKGMFILSVLLMACPTFVIGILPTYAQIGYGAPLMLLVCRILQGAAVGGEVPGSWVYVAEHAPSGRTGFACGMLTAGLTSGIFLGSAVNIALHLVMTPAEIAAYAWRLPFLLGGVAGLLGTVLRHKLAETPIFEEMRRTAQIADGAPLNRVFRGELKPVIVSMAVSWLLTAEVVVMILMAPVLLQHGAGLSEGQIAFAGSSSAVCLSIGCILSGVAIDRFGLSSFVKMAVVPMVVAPYVLFGGVHLFPSLYLSMFMVTGLVAGCITFVPVVMVRSFPPAVAFSGVALAYNVAYALAGGLTPPLVSALYNVSLLAPAHYVAFVCVVGVSATLAGAAIRSRLASSSAHRSNPA